MEQQKIRRRFSHILASSIGMCRAKHAAESPSRVPREPVRVPDRARKPRLADLFSADSDTLSSTTRCEKFESDKTWSGSEAERASMSHLSPFEYETCNSEFDKASRAAAEKCTAEMTPFQTKTTPFHVKTSPDYYRKSCSRRSTEKQKQESGRAIDPKPERGFCSNSRSDSDIASSVLVELLQPFPESVGSNVTNECATSKIKRSSTSHAKRRRRRARKSRVVVEGGSMAVAKSSVDPYGDFRRSMVEMIVEKEIFEKAELEELLMRFLALNSPDHHKIIVFVFVEILEIVFSNSISK